VNQNSVAEYANKEIIGKNKNEETNTRGLLDLLSISKDFKDKQE